MKTGFTICVYDKRSRHGFLYYVATATADAAVQQFYDDAGVTGRAPKDFVTVAVFNGHLTDSLSWLQRRE
ncbi:MAG TPA: hypothetical protein VHC22_02055 [Pirellulales bacterium]|nr:hypothetical protein [Pirellulales bacterium]